MAPDPLLSRHASRGAMHRLTRWVLVLALALTTVILAPPSLAAGCTQREMYVVAHQDDSLLFQSPDLQRALKRGDCVTTVYLTAGDGGQGQGYWGARESGALAGYAQIMGRPTVDASWTRGSTSAGGHTIPTAVLTDFPNVVQMFLRLPDGGYDGTGFATYDRQSLQKLWTGALPSLRPVDGAPAYGKQDLVATLTALMTQYRPDVIRVQDYVPGEFVRGGDHSDHYASAFFARAAHQQYTTPHQFVGYVDYRTETMPENVSGAELTAKQQAFYAYAAYDPVCDVSTGCAGSQYANWLKRQYVAGSESGGSTANQPPVANAGPAQTVATGATVQLSGSGTDPDGNALTYRWTQTSGPAVALSDPAAAAPTFTAPSVTGDTALGFQLVVNDGTVDSAPSAVTVTVRAAATANTAPVANAGAEQTVAVKAVVTLRGSGTDAEGQPLTYRWTQTSGKAVVLEPSATVAQPTFRAPASAGTLTFQLVVSDGQATSAPSTVRVVVRR